MANRKVRCEDMWCSGRFREMSATTMRRYTRYCSAQVECKLTGYPYVRIQNKRGGTLIGPYTNMRKRSRCQDHWMDSINSSKMVVLAKDVGEIL